MELAGLVREGYMDRAEALSRLQEAASPEVVDAVQARLGGVSWAEDVEQAFSFAESLAAGLGIGRDLPAPV